MSKHLWYWQWGEGHAPGETAEDARRWLADTSGMPLEDCGESEEWVMVTDGAYMRDEDGSIPIPAETAAQYAESLARSNPVASRGHPAEDAPVSPAAEAFAPAKKSDS